MGNCKLLLIFIDTFKGVIQIIVIVFQRSVEYL